MGPIRKYIREISGPTGPYTIRAKVIEKTNVYYERDGHALELHMITFQDEEGTKMTPLLYNEELEVFVSLLQEDMEYDISNAKIQAVLHKPSECTIQCAVDQAYDLFLNINTMIQPVSAAEAHAKPNYVLIGSIPREISLDQRYDVLGVVIYVDPCCQLIDYHGQPLNVCEVVIADHSHEQVMMIIAWSNLAFKECAALNSTAAYFPVNGFTTLMPSYKKGFSLSTTHSTFIIIDPPGEETDMLRTWANENRTGLAEKSRHIFEVRLPETTRTIITIESLLEKRPRNTLQEEHYWLHVKLNEFRKNDVHLYLGCSTCGTGNIQELGAAYTCTACLNENVTSTPRMAITFEAADGTGQYTLTSYTTNAETLLEVEATILYSIPAQDRDIYLGYIENKLKNSRVYVEVTPTTVLNRTQELKWMLRQVSLI